MARLLLASYAKLWSDEACRLLRRRWSYIRTARKVYELGAFRYIRLMHGDRCYERRNPGRGRLHPTVFLAASIWRGGPGVFGSLLFHHYKGANIEANTEDNVACVDQESLSDSSEDPQGEEEPMDDDLACDFWMRATSGPGRAWRRDVRRNICLPS